MMLLTILDRGQREIPIQPDFCGSEVPIRKNETIDLKFNQFNKDEGIFLCIKI
tara:strand:- start:376 stop:534 length:159 start_codon:yes stop_codon:yes gene_type:complete